MKIALSLILLCILLGGVPLAGASQPGERPETLTLLRELGEEPLAKDATRDVPPVIDEKAAACLAESPARPAAANDSAPSLPAAEGKGNPTGGVQ